MNKFHLSFCIYFINQVISLNSTFSSLNNTFRSTNELRYCNYSSLFIVHFINSISNLILVGLRKLVEAQKIQSSSGVSVQLKRYFQANWGAPLILVFMLLLMFVTVALSLSLSSLVEKLAVSAFCMLVTGVVLQLVSFVKNSDKNIKEATV